MLERAVRSFIFVLAVGVLAASCSAQSALRVDETATKAQLRLGGLATTLVVQNASHAPVPAQVRIELVDPTGVVRTHTEQDTTLRAGSTKVNAFLPWKELPGLNEKVHDILWYRIRYSVEPRSSSEDVRPSSGIVGLGGVLGGIFDLRVATPNPVREGEHYMIYVRAIQPATGHPVSQVTVQGSIDVDADDGKPIVTHTATTDAQGFATLEFTLPKNVDDDDADITVTGKLGDFSTEATGRLYLRRSSNVSVTTDKPLYQPGQALHARVMVFDSNNSAAEKQSVTLKITDPDETLVYRTDLETSEFGIAAAEWQIPDNFRLGSYTLQASIGAEAAENRASGSATVTVSRYELPNFSVTVKADRDYYLPGQDASIEVHGDYLFGKPVRHGHVRVVQETERHWNYREQKWDLEEGASYEGEADEQGVYTAKVDLGADHKKLQVDDYERFQDLSFAAYFTDESSGRTEQRRFFLRLTKDSIHIYVIAPRGSLSGAPPLELYLSTDYADGTPASCDVNVGWVREQRSSQEGVEAPRVEQAIRRVHTNRYGVAKIGNLIVPGLSDTDSIALTFSAVDRHGATGQHTESIWYTSQPEILVSTDKTLYKPGEPISVQLRTGESDETVVVEAVSDDRVMASRIVRVRHGRADVVFDGTEKFKNEVTIVAYSLGLKSSIDSTATGSHTVLFPNDRTLKLDVKFGKSVYRPGDEAIAEVNVTSPNGSDPRSALGLVVVDKALEERERTDTEFGAQRGGFDAFFTPNDDAIGGVHLSDLNKLDLSKPIPDGLELVAQVLLQNNAPWRETFGSENYTGDLNSLFAPVIDPQMLPILEILNKHYEKTGVYPTTQEALDLELTSGGHPLQDIRDPWGTPYRARFSVERERSILKIESAGPDKTFDSSDDFVVSRVSWEYFKSTREAIRAAIDEYHARTGGYIRDEQTLASELSRAGIDLRTLKDPWGRPYRFMFGILQTQFTVKVTAAMPDGFDRNGNPDESEITLAIVGIDYFAATRARLDDALASYFTKNLAFPENLGQLKQALKASGIEWDQLRDAWGRPFYATFKEEAAYSDDLKVESYATHVANEGQRTKLVPVTRKSNFVYVRSAGEDGIEGTQDDFSAAVFSRAVLEQSGKDKTAVAAKDQTVLSGANGAITGVVTDPTGAVIPGTKVNARSMVTQEVYGTETGASGEYTLRNLPAGYYSVEFSALGFQVSSITDVPVRSSNVTRLDEQLNIGSSSETVTVTEAAPQLATESASILSLAKISPGVVSISNQASTPRLREYFPETLLWRPEVITDRQGRARVKFPLADNITTWKLTAIASTKNGELGTAQKEFRAFQPFFVDHDPPRFLTQGDEISLPVTLRNYLDRPIALNVELKPSPWFTNLSPTPLQANVSPQDSTREVFRFRAISVVKNGKQEVVANGADASDAISRVVTVRPNGQEKTASVSQVFERDASIDLTIPDQAIAGSVETELKIYPNLQAHVLESIEAVLERPYGCAEQTISSAYPSVLLLRYARDARLKDSPLVPRARRYVQIGYERLLAYRAATGGFTYWGRGDADLALTVYAIRFLNDAQEFIPIDDTIIQEAVAWVVNQSQGDGRWIARDWQGHEAPQRSTLLTAYIARTFVTERLVAQGPATSASQSSAAAKTVSSAVRNALAYLQPKVASIDEPYVIAEYSLAALGMGDRKTFETGVARLLSLEHCEGDLSYWALESNTPFYGWGLAGRIETTALVLQALASAGDSATTSISRGLLFLLRSQDRYGIWYSGQATVNVLETMATLTSTVIAGADDARSASGAAKAEVSVDGKLATSVDLQPANELTGPILLDLSKFVAQGQHRIEIHQSGVTRQTAAQLVANYFVPWAHSATGDDLHHESTASDALSLTVAFDKRDVAVGDVVRCEVDAERVGFRGYGMMLAEIGLPPGAEVDRSSLEAAMSASGWSLSQYDILPDRVVVYLWPQAGGTKFSFGFKLRFGEAALTAPSTLYDYYNPEARAVVEPTPFIVK
jgi:hypothetical protein